MSSSFFNDLKELLEKLPGIGPRQASRFIWAMLDFESKEREKMASLISNLDSHLTRCVECFRAFGTATPGSSKPGFETSKKPGFFPPGVIICPFCQPNSSRDHSKIMVVERDSDLLNIEKSKIYNGIYHVLGGALDPLEKDDSVRKKIKNLLDRISRSSTSDVKSSKTSDVFPREIIIALSPTKLGEFTASFIEKIFEPLSKSRNIKISRLARGLATGTDLEYADEMTLRQAIDNRK